LLFYSRQAGVDANIQQCVASAVLTLSLASVDQTLIG